MIPWIAIMAAVLTPQDPASMLLLAAALYGAFLAQGLAAALVAVVVVRRQSGPRSAPPAEGGA